MKTQRILRRRVWGATIAAALFVSGGWAIGADTPCCGGKALSPDAASTTEAHASNVKEILTPAPGPEPVLHGPTVVGVRPGHPFLYRIPCTGARPMRFKAQGLPVTMTLDPATGIITGRAPTVRGTVKVRFTAHNDRGGASRELRIVVGDTLALTPPMGWNSWYIYRTGVTQADMEKTADAVVSSGMADAGYQYVNVDDGWMMRHDKPPTRGANGAVLPNRHKFPDIAGMVRHIHDLGLRAGVYTSPGPMTCAGCEGAYGHEKTDAEQFAAWGFDFLKYDWCSYGKFAKQHPELPLKAPYEKMGAILTGLDRDVVFNLCQYGMGQVWTWGADVGGNCWRTTGDLGNMKGGRLPGFYKIALKNMAHWEYAKPGHYNDPDYLLLGWIAVNGSRRTAPTTLTGDEQYSYMSLWSLMASPLIYSGDMTKLDAFTLNVLCNPEVIDVDQDALCRQGRPIVSDEHAIVLVKPLEDGSVAVGLFNLDETARPMTLTWTQAGIKGPQRVRDLWREKNLGTFDGKLTLPVNRHGVQMVRLWPIKS